MRIGCGPGPDGRAGHVAADCDATAVGLDVGRPRLRSFRLTRIRRKEIDENRPQSGRRNDQPAAEPSQNLLIALIAQESPERVHDSNR